jgi:hypothetical protein
MVFALEAFRGANRFGRKRSSALYRRTLWLGSMNAVVPGMSERPLKNLQAATIRMSKARIAIKSTCLGS